MRYWPSSFLAVSVVWGALAGPAQAKADSPKLAEGADQPAAAEEPAAPPENPDAPSDPRWIIPEDLLIPATPQRVPSYGERDEWSIVPYGYMRLDAIEDSTQSFESGIGSSLIQRVGTYQGDHRRTTFTGRDSRIGIQVGAPTFPEITPMRKGARTTGLIEFDFFGLTPTDAKRQDAITLGPVRLRQAYLKLETWFGTLVAGQTYDLFGWGNYFYPASVGYLGVPGQIFHRNPQLRLEWKFRSDDGDLELMFAVAAVAPAQRDSGFPDGQAGLKFAYKGWKGAGISGLGTPNLVPLSIGVSGIYRRFEVPAFRSNPGSESWKTFGWGAAVSAVLPVIPIDALYDRGNALTLTGEFSIGTGIADMYSGMDGGSRFPVLPNPSLAAPHLVYPVNVDPGLVTIDRNFTVKSINWRGMAVGGQYYFPFGPQGGRLWLSAVYSRAWSDNIKALTPFTSWGAIFTKIEYIDASLGVELTPAVVLGLSVQTVQQTFADVTAPEPNYEDMPVMTPGRGGGVPFTARNNRAQLSVAFFF